ncbi:MAG: phosphoribosylanthranilate isomerase [Planctomycetaceae bacterium]|nr:phosphoribosylanthranilate isomerase [Planctomycetaceae bacterium]
MSAMFRVKICGITTVDDARQAVDAGADAIGLNFYANSPRCVSIDAAREIADAVRDAALVVGVFVNESPTGMMGIATEVGLGALQVHGDEPPELLARLPDRPLIRVRRIDQQGVAAVAADLAACRAAGRAPQAVLVDAAAAPGQYGGTGHAIPWELLADHDAALGETPLILAGGLKPDNVAAAIRAVRPAGVDTASGVESAPGKKDPQKVAAFVAAARAALTEVGQAF